MSPPELWELSPPGLLPLSLNCKQRFVMNPFPIPGEDAKKRREISCPLRSRLIFLDFLEPQDCRPLTSEPHCTPLAPLPAGGWGVIAEAACEPSQLAPHLPVCAAPTLFGRSSTLVVGFAVYRRR
jgi:hypothetical protein